MQPSLTLQERIRDRSEPDENGCWLWQLRVSKQGYGQYHMGSRSMGDLVKTGAHRISYIAFHGEVPEGLHIDHLCSVRRCVNPAHLEAVTPKENVNRSDAYYKKEAARTHCPKGHAYTKSNLYTYPTRWGGVSRNCKTCMQERSKRNYRLRKGLAYAA